MKCPKCRQTLLAVYVLKDRKKVPVMLKYCWHCEMFYKVKLDEF